MHSRVILKLFENYKCPSIAIFFSRVPDVFKEQSCFIGLYDDLLLISNLFHFFYFIFSAPISFSLCFPVSPPPLLFYALSQAFIKHSRKAFVYIYANNMHNIYFRKLMNFCLTKKFTTFGFHLFDLVWIECYAAKSPQSCPTVQPNGRQPTRLPRPWDSPGKNTGVGCHFLLQCMKVKSESEVAQSCPTLSNPMDCSLPGSPVHGTPQARAPEWGAIALSIECYISYLKR